MVFFINSFFGFAVVFLFCLVVTLIAKIPILKFLNSIKLVLGIMLFTAVLTAVFGAPATGNYGTIEIAYGSWWIFNIYRSSLISAGLLASRLMVLILLPTLLTLTTTPTDLTDALGWYLTPLTWIKIPVHYFTMIISIALGFIPTFRQETDRIISAQKARCAEFESVNPVKRARALIPVLIPLFIGAFRRAFELEFAMDSRCYNLGIKRTKMKKMRFSYRDLIGLITIAGLFFFILTTNYNWWDWGFVRLLTGWQ